MNIKKINILATIALLALTCISCDKDEKEDKKPAVQQDASFTISGAINGKKAGVAAVVFSESGGLSMKTISIHEHPSIPQTYSLSFIVGPSPDAEIPGVGNYTIGFLGKPETDFGMGYTNTETGTEYSSNGELVGTLTIEESTETYIKGSFAFEAPEFNHLGTSDTSGKPGITVADGRFMARIAE